MKGEEIHDFSRALNKNEVDAARVKTRERKVIVPTKRGREK